MRPVLIWLGKVLAQHDVKRRQMGIAPRFVWTTYALGRFVCRQATMEGSAAGNVRVAAETCPLVIGASASHLGVFRHNSLFPGPGPAQKREWGTFENAQWRVALPRQCATSRVGGSDSFWLLEGRGIREVRPPSLPLSPLRDGESAGGAPSSSVAIGLKQQPPIVLLTVPPQLSHS